MARRRKPNAEELALARAYIESQVATMEATPSASKIADAVSRVARVFSELRGAGARTEQPE